jgi:hypothetical protein
VPEVLKKLRSSNAPALSALTAFTLIFYWQVTSTLGTNEWTSNMQDGASFAWGLWNFADDLFHGRDPFVTKDIFYPLGAPLGFHTYVPLLSIISWPIVQLFGLTTAYTLMTLLGPVLSGFGAYYLALHLTKNKWAAFYAGAAYAALPDHALRMVGHLNLNQTWILPFGVLALIRFYQEPRRKTIVQLGVVLGLSLWVDAIFTSFLMVASAVTFLCALRRSMSRSMLVDWLKVGAVSFATASPILLAMFRDIKNKQLDPLPGWGEANHENADVLSYFIPSEFNPVTGSWFGHLSYVSGEKFTFIGWTVVALAIAGLFLWKSQWKKTITVMLATFFVLSLGPFLKIAGWKGDWFTYLKEDFSIPLPYFAIHFVPILNGVRIPARFGFMTDLLVIVLAAGALAVIATRLKAPQRKPWLMPVITLVAVALMTVESLPGDVPPQKPTAIPAPYTAIKNDPGNGAVLEIPLQWRDGFGHIGDGTVLRDHTVFMYYATKHEKPLVNGMIARYPDKSEIALQKIPAYSQILTLQNDADPQPITFGVNDLRSLGIGYVVAHRDTPMPRVFDYVQNFQLPVLADDGNTIVWKVSE